MSDVECIVLGLLHMGCCYGHELDKYYKKQKMNLWTKSNRASIYQALARIEKKGWANVTIEKSTNFPDRKIYALTEQGKIALQKMIKQGLAANDLMEFKISAYFTFFDVLPLAQVIEQLEQRKKERLQLLDVIVPLTEEELQQHASDQKYFIKKHNVKLIRGYYLWEVEWLEDLIDELKDKMN